jgi:hypothetical protein
LVKSFPVLADKANSKISLFKAGDTRDILNCDH